MKVLITITLLKKVKFCIFPFKNCILHFVERFVKTELNCIFPK